MAFNSVILYFFIVFILSIIPKATCQSQNVETFYPFPLPNLLPPPLPPVQRSPPSPPPPLPPDPTLPPDTPVLPPSVPTPDSSSKKAVGTAIGVTAASTLVLAALLFFFLVRYSRRRRQQQEGGAIAGGGGTSGVSASASATPGVVQDQFLKFEGNLKGVIVDENGLDVLYWRKLESGEQRKESFKKKKVFVNALRDDEEEKRMISRVGGGGRKISDHPNQELPLLRGKSSTSQSPSWLELENKQPSPSDGIVFKAMEKQESSSQLESRVPPPAPPPAPPLPVTATPKAPGPPPPPPPTIRKGPPLPPPPSGLPSSSSEGTSGSGKDKVKLKPLHWDKLNANVEHSMVWDKLDRGSFK